MRSLFKESMPLALVSLMSASRDMMVAKNRPPQIWVVVGLAFKDFQQDDDTLSRTYQRLGGDSNNNVPTKLSKKHLTWSLGLEHGKSRF